MMNDARAASAFAAMGHAHRVEILRLLVRAGTPGLNVKSLREKLDLPATTLAHHLRMLTDVGLVAQEKMGREVISRAEYGMIRQLNEFLMKDCCRDAFCAPSAA